MRIAYVTAHYPPDLTSGATLQVERLARRAAEIGHHVEVFSGAIAQGLADGEMRTEHADDVTVHWIGTADRVEQGDDRNWHNPGAGAATAAWLATFRPDVVHMHTLQTLGVDVVEAAVASGARTVLTMHDLWWWCARLFLVDTALQPCPLVTDVGTCACARTADWRGERAARLRPLLDLVDDILVPSVALREVVIANGLDPERVTVDGNDLGAADLADTRRAADAAAGAEVTTAVRFLYIGGASPLKGADVVVDAVRQLTATGGADGWRVHAYGLDSGVTLPDHCRRHEPFPPERLAEVLAGADVLLVASIARESFSIAAREALAAGLAVITSDCLGPEEVVRDGHNGLVVPTGDPVALAHAMRTLVDDRQLLATLRATARAEPVEVRTTAQHVDALVERYGAPAPPRHERGALDVLFVVGADGAIARYRVHHPREALALHGATTAIVHYLDPALARAAEKADVVVLQRVPATLDILRQIEALRERGALVLFDTDDLIFDPDLAGEIPTLAARPATERDHYLDGVRRYRTTLDACDGAIVATSALAEHVVATTGLPAAVVANGVGLVEMRLAERSRTRFRRVQVGDVDRVRVAYFSGSDSHQPDLAMVSGSLAATLARHPDVEVLIVGPLDPDPALAPFGDRVHHLPAQPWQRLTELLGSVDINLAPLVLPSRFNEAKSAVKWLEAALVEVPTIASASPAFTETIEHGRTGLLCGASEDWESAIEALVGDPALRRRMGAAARRAVELRHGPHVTARTYAAAIESLRQHRDVGDRHLERRPTDHAVAPDERAPSVPPLDPYVVDDSGTARRGVIRRIGDRLRGRPR